MSEEIKDLFQRENIKTMKKDLRSLAEFESRDKKEQFLNAAKKEKTAVPIPPPPDGASIKMPAPEPEEREFLKLDAAQQMANRFSRIKRDQEAKSKLFEEQSQKELEERRKTEEQNAAEQKRKEEERLAEQKKKETEQKEKERLDRALSLAQENIINTAKVPPAPAASRPAQSSIAAAPSAAPGSGPASPGKDQYKEPIEGAEKTEAPKPSAKKGVPFFSAPEAGQKPDGQNIPSAAVKQKGVKISPKETPIKNPAIQIRQEGQIKPAAPAPEKTETEEKKEENPGEKPVSKPVQAGAGGALDEKELLKSLDEKEKSIDKDLLKAAQEKIPVNLQSEEISKEIEKIRQSQLQGIVAKEAEVESAVKRLEAEERSAASAEEKRKIEAERQEIETRREKIEEQRYQIEDSMKNLEAQLNECKNNYSRISEKEKKLLKEKAGIKNQREIIGLSKRKTALEQSLAELNAKTDSLKSGLSSLLKEKDALEERLGQVSEEEQKTEAEVELLEKQEAGAKDPASLRTIEAQRKTLAAKRKEAEKKRWEIEDRKKEMEARESEIKKEYQKTVKKIEESSKELKTIEDKSSQYDA